MNDWSEFFEGLADAFFHVSEDHSQDTHSVVEVGFSRTPAFDITRVSVGLVNLWVYKGPKFKNTNAKVRVFASLRNAIAGVWLGEGRFSIEVTPRGFVPSHLRFRV